MITIISPAKKLDFNTPPTTDVHSDLIFPKPMQDLATVAKKLSSMELKSMMKISDSLADLNYNRFQDLQYPFTPDTAKQAVLCFAGDTYTGLDASTLDTDSLMYAQKNLRILSGLYGVLRPLDLMQPYRLEMGVKITTPMGNDLYTYWRDSITQYINEKADKDSAQAVVNCASQEYFKAVNTKDLNIPIIEPVFKEVKNGVAKIVSFSAKRARGMMARFIMENRIENPADISNFNMAGYEYQPQESTPEKPIFYRIHT